MIVIGVDFDETIVTKDKDNNLILLPNVKESMINIVRHNYIFVLNTCRGEERFDEAVSFIKKNKLPVYITLDDRKVSADIYIDDKNLGCKGIDWKDIEKELLNE